MKNFDFIRICGAREHNLKNISLSLPRNQLIVFTGVSGSGKSSLAFDTIFAEGQRRYVESLSAYARQFLGQLDKPDLDYIEGLSPAISIDQKSSNRNPRSTVGTVTEIYDYLRLLFARIGVPHCPKCGKEINPQTIEQIVDAVLLFKVGTRFQILAPLVRGRKGENKHLLEEAQKEGFVRVRIDEAVYDLGDTPDLDKNKKHDIAVVIDRMIVREGIETRLADSLGTALKKAEGLVVINVLGTSEAPEDRDVLYSEHFACQECGISIEEITPRLFSFNNPFGACPACHGLGSKLEFDTAKLIPDPSKSLREGAVLFVLTPYYLKIIEALAKKRKFSLDQPFCELSPEIEKLVLYGSNEKLWVEHETFGSRYTQYEGALNTLTRRYEETQSERQREEMEAYMTARVCAECGGKRLRPESLAVTVGDRSIHDIVDMPLTEARVFFQKLILSPRRTQIASQILKEIGSRLQFLLDVGLEYLTLARTAASLSGGESQRIRLATQIGSGLVGVLYVLDEPSIGLHSRDNARLLATLKKLRDLGNSLIVVEHDEETIRMADHLVDIGPFAGVHGGRIVAEGQVEDLEKQEESLTGDYLAGRRFIPVPSVRRIGNGNFIRIEGAQQNNLKDLDLSFPLGQFVCVTGVSGSGKSTLVNDVLHSFLHHHFRGGPRPTGARGIAGLEAIDKVIVIDQSPIGRTPRSNPATYTGLFDPIRELYSNTLEAKARGYLPGRFSFNLKGGRCEACSGEGVNRIEMHFLPDVYVPCEICKGKRYNRETLEVRFKGKNIHEVLEMTVGEALEFFANIPKLSGKLKTLAEVGLDYIKLGQPATTLSGGEAQRVKLATELSRRATTRTLYLLDEPTTGLHFHDVNTLLQVLHRLVDNGNTVICIEHNLDVIKTADTLIDLGPEGGERGGRILVKGTPEEVARCKDSYTGQFLAPLLNSNAVLH